MEIIALTGPFDAQMQAAILEELPDGFEIILVPSPDEFDKLQDVDYIIMRTVEMREESIKTLRKIKFIQRWGVGYDIIDIKAAGGHNIPGICEIAGLIGDRLRKVAQHHGCPGWPVPCVPRLKRRWGDKPGFLYY